MLIAIGSQELASWIFGGLTLLFLIGAFCFGPERLPEWKRSLLGYVCAVSSGLFGFFFTGAITLKIESEITDYSRIAIQAIGGFALFVFVLWWWGRRDKNGKRKNESLSFDAGPVLSKALAEYKGRTEEQIEQLKDDLSKAVERIKKLEIEGNRPDAEKALEELRESGDMRRLQELLIRDREEHRDALIQRNREIAAVACLRGDIGIALEAVNEILKELPEDLFALNQRGFIHSVQGKLKEAEGDFNCIMELAKEAGNIQACASALCNLGLIYMGRGELDKAEEMYLNSLEIAEKLELKGVMASGYGNLGNVYYMRGDLGKAEDMHLKSLEIDKELGRLEGVASDYGNLGNIYYTQGELDKAEEMQLKSLEIVEKLELKGVMASNYAALGLVYQKREKLDKAETMHLKGLEIEKKIGRLEGIARQYGNLGIVYLTRGDLDKAEEAFLKILKIHEQLSDEGGKASDYGNLGSVYYTRGELDKAEEMYEKSVELEKKLGRLEGMANSYGNLGRIYKKRGDIGKAKEYLKEAVDLYKRIGLPHMVDEVEGWIRG